MNFVVQKLLPAIQPEQRLVLAGSESSLHSCQGAWDGGCTLHCAAMALAMLGYLRDPNEISRYADGPEAKFWDRAAPYYLNGITSSELVGLFAELNWGLRTTLVDSTHDKILRFCERELSQGWPVIVNWQHYGQKLLQPLPRPPLHSVLAIGLEGRTRGRRFEPHTMLMLDPGEKEPRLATCNARLSYGANDSRSSYGNPGAQAHSIYITTNHRNTVVLDSALSIRPASHVVRTGVITADDTA